MPRLNYSVEKYKFLIYGFFDFPQGSSIPQYVRHQINQKDLSYQKLIFILSLKAFIVAMIQFYYCISLQVSEAAILSYSNLSCIARKSTNIFL